MLNRKSDAVVAVLAVLTAVSLAACGGNALTGPNAVVGGTTSIVILSAALDYVEVGGQRVINFNLPHPGTLALTVRWNDESNSVVAVLTGAACPNFYGASADCQVRRTYERQGKEGREGVIDYPGASGTYRLLVENEGPGVESIRVTAELISPSTTPILPTPYPTGHPPTSHPPEPRREK